MNLRTIVSLSLLLLNTGNLFSGAPISGGAAAAAADDTDPNQLAMASPIDAKTEHYWQTLQALVARAKDMVFSSLTPALKEKCPGYVTSLEEKFRFLEKVIVTKNIDMQYIDMQYDEGGSTALMIILDLPFETHNLKSALLKNVLNLKPDLNLKNLFHRTVLETALTQGQYNFIAILLGAGANPYIGVNAYGRNLKTELMNRCGDDLYKLEKSAYKLILGLIDFYYPDAV